MSTPTDLPTINGRRYLTCRQAGHYYNVGEKRIRELIRTGDIAAIRTKTVQLIRVEDLEAYFSSATVCRDGRFS